MTAISLTYLSIQNKVKAISLPRINWKLVYIFGILLCFCLLIFYVFSINQLTQGTYLIKNYSKEIDSLSRENKNIETHLAEAGFLDQIYNKVEELRFEKVKERKYIKVLDTSLAKSN